MLGSLRSRRVAIVETSSFSWDRSLMIFRLVCEDNALMTCCVSGSSTLSSLTDTVYSPVNLEVSAYYVLLN